jgi:hypothetical protein
VSESGELRTVFGHKRENVTGGWRNVHNELNNLFSSPNIIRMIKSRKTARIREMRNI